MGKGKGGITMLQTVEKIIDRANELEKGKKSEAPTNRYTNLISGYAEVCRVELIILAIIWGLLMIGAIPMVLIYLINISEYLGIVVGCLPVIFICRHIVILIQVVLFGKKKK